MTPGIISATFWIEPEGQSIRGAGQVTTTFAGLTPNGYCSYSAQCYIPGQGHVALNTKTKQWEPFNIQKDRPWEPLPKFLGAFDDVAAILQEQPDDIHIARLATSLWEGEKPVGSLEIIHNSFMGDYCYNVYGLHNSQLWELNKAKKQWAKNKGDMDFLHFRWHDAFRMALDTPFPKRHNE